MNKEIKSVLVTGGAGYIGSHTIVELLESGYEVVSVDNFSNSKPSIFSRIEKLTGKKIENINVDLCDYKKIEGLFAGKNFDAIIHFAAKKSVEESVREPLEYYRNNIDALVGVLMIARKCRTSSFIFSSSAAVYDANANPPFTEESPLAPASPYGMTKKIGEELLEDYVAHNQALRAISLRYFNPAGAHGSLLIGENPSGEPQNLVPIMTKAAKEGYTLSVFGDDYPTRDGTCIRDYIHVVDVAKAHVEALKYLKSAENLAAYEVFNIGTGKGVSVLEMMNAFEKINHIKIPSKIGARRPGDIPSLYADTTKVRKTLTWEPKHNLLDILKTAWEWQKKKDEY